MAIEDNFANMTSQQLGTLLDNANRLAGQSGKQRIEAERLLPLIMAEQARRKPEPKPPVARKKKAAKV